MKRRLPGDAGAEGLHDGSSLAAAVRRCGGGREDVERISADTLAAQPPPHRTQEAGVVHDAVPTAPVEVWPEVVPVLRDEQRVTGLRSNPLRDLRVHVDVVEPADHVRRPDPPPVEPCLEPVLHDHVHARTELRRAPIEPRQPLGAEPARVTVGLGPVEEEERPLDRRRLGLRAHEPFVFATAVIERQVADQPQAPGAGGVDERSKRLVAAEQRVDAIER